MERVAEDRLVDAVRDLAWRLEDHELVKVVRRRDFADAIAYVNAVSALAEAANHHPDIEVRWDTVTLRLVTHSLGGISDADLALARSVDALH